MDGKKGVLGFMSHENPNQSAKVCLDIRTKTSSTRQSSKQLHIGQRATELETGVLKFGEG